MTEFQLIRECGDVILNDLPTSRSTFLRQGATSGTGKLLTLEEHSAGYTPAGSTMRWRDRCWSLHIMFNGTRCARIYTSVDAATKQFEKSTGDGS